MAVREGRWLEKGKGGCGMDQSWEPKAWGAMGRFGARQYYTQWASSCERWTGSANAPHQGDTQPA